MSVVYTDYIRYFLESKSDVVRLFAFKVVNTAFNDDYYICSNFPHNLAINNVIHYNYNVDIKPSRNSQDVNYELDITIAGNFALKRLAYNALSNFEGVIDESYIEFSQYAVDETSIYQPNPTSPYRLDSATPILGPVRLRFDLVGFDDTSLQLKAYVNLKSERPKVELYEFWNYPTLKEFV